AGVTIILTTHYIDEAAEMADRIAVLSTGEIILVEEKAELMRKLRRKQLTLYLDKTLERLPPGLSSHSLELRGSGTELIYTYAEHLQCLLRHLLPEVRRDHLRAPLGSGVLPRDRGELCGGGRDQVGRPRPHHPGDGGAAGAAQDRASLLDDPLPRADLGHLQPHRLHHRHLGGRFREAPGHTASDHHAAHLSRRQLLLHRHAAAFLADGL